MAPPGLKPIQKPMNDPRMKVRVVARQDLATSPSTTRGLIRALGAPEGQAFLHRQEDLSDPEEPDDCHDEVEALHEVGEPEGQAEVPR